MKKFFLQKIWDFIGIPFRFVLFDQNWLPKFGWTTLEEERIAAVLPHISGYLLDVGCGPNKLVKEYRNGIGVDIFDWGGDAVIVQDTSCLPFEDALFDTATIIAALNHIPNRQDVLSEIKRLIRPGGKLIITMIDPILGGVGHAIWWYGEDKKRGGMKEGEVGGLWTRDIIQMCSNAGFQLVQESRFLYSMNHLYIFEIAQGKS